MLARLASLRCVPLLILLAAAVSFRAQPSGSVKMQPLGSGAVQLPGPWKFHTGDDPAWASPVLDDSAWESVSADRPWGEQGHARYTGYAWYRVRLNLHPASARSAGLSLLVPSVDDVYEVYWNGKLVGRNGTMPPYPTWYVSQSPQIFTIGPAEDGLLAFRVWEAPPLSDDSGGAGGFTEAPWIGTRSGIAATAAGIDYRWLRSRQILFDLHLTYGLVALIAFLVWSRNRTQLLLLWMLGYALAPVLKLLLLNAHLPWPYLVTMGLSQPLTSMQDISLWLLLLWLLRLNDHRALFHVVRFLTLISMTVGLLEGCLVAIVWHPRWTVWAQSSDAVFTAINTASEMLPLMLVGSAVARRRPLRFPSWIVAALAFSDEMLVVVRSALRQGQRFTGWTLGDQLGSPLFTVSGNEISLAMISRVLLLVSIVWAVYVAYLEERRREIVMAKEFNDARELQRLLIPEAEHTIPGFEISTAYCPALEVGGDFFQLIPLDRNVDSSTLLILGDVSGHGVKAALSVSYVIGIVRILAELLPDPAPLLSEMNRRLCGRMQNGFATCIAAKIDRFGCCTLSAAGHPPPFLNSRALDVPGALPLAIDLSTQYQQMTIRLNPGDHLALYTDGLLEARSKAGELYGFQRLGELFAANPTAAEAAETAIRFGQDDDITVVTLTCRPDRGRSIDKSLVAIGSSASDS